MYTLLIMVTGWTWEYIDEHMTLPRLHLMQSYWEKSPPMISWTQIGYKHKKEEKVSVEEFYQMFSNGVKAGNGR